MGLRPISGCDFRNSEAADIHAAEGSTKRRPYDTARPMRDTHHPRATADLGHPSPARHGDSLGVLGLFPHPLPWGPMGVLEFFPPGRQSPFPIDASTSGFPAPHHPVFGGERSCCVICVYLPYARRMVHLQLVLAAQRLILLIYAAR